MNLENSDDPLGLSDFVDVTSEFYPDARTERAEMREAFRHPDLKKWATLNRNNLVWRALTLVQSWIVAGRPVGTKRLGGFEDWSAAMGGILESVGIDGFLGNLETSRSKGDVETQAIAGFVEAWAQKFGTSERAVKALMPIAGGLDLGVE